VIINITKRPITAYLLCPYVRLYIVRNRSYAFGIGCPVAIM